MTGRNDSDDALRYIANRRENIAANRKQLSRWMTPKSRKQFLSRAIASDSVVVGINRWLIGDPPGCRASFLEALDALKDTSALGAMGFGHLEVQVLSAGLLAGAVADTETLSEKALEAWTDLEHPKGLAKADRDALSRGRHGAAAIMGWIARRSAKEISEHAAAARCTGNATLQGDLWGRCASAGAALDAPGLQAGLDALAAFVSSQARSGDFRYSEDRHVYLPGLGILWLAQRDGLAPKVPTTPQWPAALLGLSPMSETRADSP